MGGFLKSKHLGAPSVFDICAILFIVIFPLLGFTSIRRGIDTRLLQALWLVFGTTILMGVSLACSKRREYKSLPLALLTLWTLVNVYIHTFRPMLDPENLAVAVGHAWLTWEVMCEGFVYIFFAVFLIRTIATYAKSWGWYYLPLIFSFTMAYDYTFAKGMTPGDWSMTPILAVCIGGTLTLVRIKKTRIWANIPLIMGIVAVVYKWNYIWKVKWVSRPDFWKVALQRLHLSKYLGHGFYHTVNTKDGLVAPRLEGSQVAYVIERWGMGWRQNDLLEYGEYAGAIGMLLVAWFFIHTLWKGKPGFAYFLALSMSIMCLVQRTMFFPNKAGIVLIALSLLILETGRLKLLPQK